MVNIAVLKIGNIGVAPLFEFLFDERAERENITFRVFGSGSKMIYDNAKENIEVITTWKPDLIVFITPNAGLKVPKQIIEELRNVAPLILVSDSPALKSVDWFESKGNVGYILITGDPMIGARREFLDPTEVALFNADVIKVLSNTEVFKFVYKIVDNTIATIEKQSLVLPKVIINSDYLMANLSLNNPYAKAKAIAAYKMAELVGKINIEACFKVQEWKKYTLLTAIAHEVMLTAAKLSEEAREIEKSNDTVVREPHDTDGSILKKIKLLDKPK
ncbi:MAG: F420-dependent methylenetetrahydromethanopterin dehydrogenase [Candidatus Odinarchaeia archaeon]